MKKLGLMFVMTAALVGCGGGGGDDGPDDGDDGDDGSGEVTYADDVQPISPPSAISVTTRAPRPSSI